jgi:hypothetical protein
MGSRDEPTARLRRRLQAALENTLAESVSWAVSTDGPVVAQLPDREFVFERRDGPDGHRWTVVLRAEGAVVSKFGQFETVDDAVATVESLAATDIQYTVCCDG